MSRSSWARRRTACSTHARAPAIGTDPICREIAADTFQCVLAHAPEPENGPTYQDRSRGGQ